MKEDREINNEISRIIAKDNELNIMNEEYKRESHRIIDILKSPR